MSHILKYALACLAFSLLLTTSSKAADVSLHPSGTVVIVQRQAGYYLTVGTGGGVLHIGGHSYAFKLNGLGVGGTGFASTRAVGTVYNLHSVHAFAGRYLATRTGFVIGNSSRGKLWLKNSNGVYLELSVQRKGLMLSTGVDGLVVTMK